MIIEHRIFGEVWIVDFEFREVDGQIVSVWCMVAHEVCSGTRIALWADELARTREVPFDVGPNSLVVAFFASAEMRCFDILGWSWPVNIVDLYPEFRTLANGLVLPFGRGLLGACAYFSIDVIDAMHKESMRFLAERGGPFTGDERAALLAYCESDVIATVKLLSAMTPKLRIEYALLRGRYIRSVAMMEQQGVPLDAALALRISAAREELKTVLIARFGLKDVFDGTTLHLSGLAKHLAHLGVTGWPLTPMGRLKTDDETFKTMARRYPSLEPLHQLRGFLGQMRSSGLKLSADGRNRTLLSPFSSVTGRNQPSSAEFIFGCPSWLRGIVQPAHGRALAYLDFRQEEFAIAAVLSRDKAMLGAYLTGDPYLQFAKMAGAVPASATEESHPRERNLYKVCAGLGALFGMSAETLAAELSVPPAVGEDLLRQHRLMFPRYWEWSERAVDCGQLLGSIHTTFGWVLWTHCGTNPRTLRNFPMQANGAEILRIAAILGHDAGVEICAPVHDAFLIEADTDDIDDAVTTMRRCMEQASRVVLHDFPLRTHTEVLIHYPDRWPVKKGKDVWDTVTTALGGTR